MKSFHGKKRSVDGDLMDGVYVLLFHEKLENKLEKEKRQKKAIQTYIYDKEIKALGGYPVGIAGKGMLMLSGGIDSPVAGYLAMKRGVKLECIYFESPPHTSVAAKNKVKKLVSIFPGSRVFELKQLMSIFVESAKKLQNEHPDLQFCISHAPNLSDEVYNKYLKKTDFKVIKGENQALLSCSDALILASGTVALEACLYQVPMIIAYRGPWLFYFIYLMVRCIKKVSLPNIIADKMIVPEIIQGAVSVRTISRKIERILYNESYRKDYIGQLGEVKMLLSDKTSSFEAANIIADELCNKS